MLSQVVNKADTTTALTSSVNPSKFGQSVTLTATVSITSPGSAAVANPSGTMNFYDGATSIGTGTLSTGVSGTTASMSTYSLAVGTHSITASYAGDANYNSSSPSPRSQEVNKADTTTTLASSANPSVSGQSVSFTATVSVSSPGTTLVAFPSGTVKFYDGDTWIASGGASTTAGMTTATFSTSTLSTASHSITAQYGGDSNFNDSSSSVLSQVVSKADTTTALTSSVNPSKFGQSVTLTATVSVSSPGSAAVAYPSGTVNFYDGATSIGSGPLSTAGGVTTASMSTYSLAVGTHSITASYAGDANFNSSTSSPLSQVVSKADTSTSVVSSANPSVSGQSVSFTATVSVSSPGTTLVA